MPRRCVAALLPGHESRRHVLASPCAALVGHSDAISPQTHTPGADDNASGVAALIELGGALARDPPAQPVELVAWTLEEPPFFRTRDMGSARHADALKAAGTDVELAISIEMIGYFSDAPGSQQYPIPGMRYAYPDRGDFIALVGRFGDFVAMRRAKAVFAGSTALPVTSINAPALVPASIFPTIATTGRTAGRR